MKVFQRLVAVAAVAAVLPLLGVQTASAAPGDPPRIVPAPASANVVAGASFTLSQSTPIVGSGPVSTYLAGILRRSTGYPFPITSSGTGIVLSLSGAPSMAQEAHKLDVTSSGIMLTARTEEGLMRAVQTLRQLLPPKVESTTVQPGPWTIEGVSITDQPRFSWRGTMLDVARHFFSVAEVKRYIDQAALYKFNVLHLHLADDQGWRIQIDSWPNLTAHGGSTEVGGGAGGYYTKQQYAEIVSYAADRFITVVPEIDMPGHTHAALASYAELNCDRNPPPLYTGIAVGFSSLCISNEVTYRFVDDVVRELAAMTPGQYIHVGGDEAASTPQPDYVAFMNRVGGIVAVHGKKLVGWQEIGQATLPADATGQFWDKIPPSAGAVADSRSVVDQGGKLVMSPANAAYLDMKYNSSSPFGLSWAGYVDVQQAYAWDPATVISGIGDADIRGVEAPLWTETISNITDAEFMANPRLPAIAEIGWSPAATHNWQDFRVRLGAQGPRWDVLNTTYYRTTQIPWATATGNLAQSRLTTASSTEAPAFPAANATDGDLGTRWSSGYTDADWLQVDLGSSQNIGRVTLRWEAAYGRGYRIDTSNDATTWTPIYSTTTGDGGVDDLTGLTGTGRYVRMQGVNRATSWGYSLYEVEVYAGTTSPVDLARGKAAVASSIEAANFPAADAVDGNPGTRWSSLYTDPQWLRVDLGSTFQISQVKLTWENAYGRGYRIEMSNDAANWTPIYSTTTGDGGTDNLTGLTGAGRYLRVYGTARGTQWGYSLWSVEAYS